MLIYVMGRGFSGSTILDIALSQSVGVCGMGELISGFRKTKICACGKYAKDCKHWENLHSGSMKVDSDDLAYIKQQSNIKYFFKYYFCSDKKFEEFSTKYMSINESILQARKKGDDCSVLIDSSKEITRGLILSRSNEDVVIIHLIKNPINVISSYLKRVESGEGFRFLRKKYNSKTFRLFPLFISSLGWLMGNLLCEAIKHRTEKKVITIRYEDLSKNPDLIVSKIEKATKNGFQQTKIFLKGEISAKNLHQLGGNKVKREKDIIFVKQKIKYEKSRLKRIENIIAMAIIFPLKKYYGY